VDHFRYVFGVEILFSHIKRKKRASTHFLCRAYLQFSSTLNFYIQ